MTTANGDATVDFPSLESDIEILPLGDADLDRALVILLARLTSVGDRRLVGEVPSSSSLVGDLVFRTLMVGGKARLGGFWTESPSFGDAWDMYQTYRGRTLEVW